MPIFRVTCYKAGEWDGAQAREIEAEDEQDAAEQVCGAPLVTEGKLGELRAQVSPVSEPVVKKMFYFRP
jgi:hypothetical protein